jgi:epoxide hydrolase-like predicted phosphatase
MIKVILFDLGGVVTETKFDDVLIKYGSEYGWNLAQLRDKIFGEEYFLLLKGQLTLDEFIVYLAKSVDNVMIEDLRRFVDEYYHAELVREEVREIILKLKWNFKVALITNDIGRLYYKLVELDLLGLFDEVINSYQVGFCKPDIEIYKYALKKFKVEGKECLYIDNNDKSLESAKELGIKVIKFKDTLKLEEELKNLELF